MNVVDSVSTELEHWATRAQIERERKKRKKKERRKERKERKKKVCYKTLI